MTGFSLVLFLVLGARSSSPLVATSEVRDAIQQDTKPPESVDFVSVKLVLDDGRVAGGAVVSLASAGTFQGFPLHSIGDIADASTGRVRFKELRSGHYVLVARWTPKRGSPEPMDILETDLDRLPKTDPVWWGFRDGVSASSEELELVLTRGKHQLVTVKTAEGEPVKKVRVRLALKSSASFTPAPGSMLPLPLQMDCRLETSAGRFVLDGLVPGEWEYVFAAQDHGRTGILSSSLPTESALDISIPRFLTIAGEVHGPDGVSLAKCWVGVEYETSRTWMFEDSQVATYADAAGKFLITSVRPGRATLKASFDRERHVAEIPLVIESGKNLENLRLELRARN